LVVFSASLLAVTLLLFYLDFAATLRQVHVRVSKLTLGALCDGNRLTLVALWCKPTQAAETWHWVHSDVERGSPTLWGGVANRPAPFGKNFRSHRAVRRGWYPPEERTVWMPLWAAAALCFLPAAAAIYLEMRSRRVVRSLQPGD
jgi:hypothetical protein